jgi:hypothetical protein
VKRSMHALLFAAACAGAQPAAGTWTPPTETAAVAAIKGPLDPAKLPDIGGVHIGEGSEQAVAALKKIHPGAQLTAILQSANMPSAGVTLNFGNYQPPPSWDNKQLQQDLNKANQAAVPRL